MKTTTLATFRIDKRTWKKFKKWAGEKNSNASAELNQFILRALGLIDENLDTDINSNLEQCIENYLDANLDGRIEKAVKNYLDTNIDKYIDSLTTQDLGNDKDVELETNLDKSIDNNIDINIDANQLEELDSNIDTCIDKEEPLAESKIKQSNEQLTNAELARRMKVSPSTVSKWANQKYKPPQSLEWQYDPKLKKWVK